MDPTNTNQTLSREEDTSSTQAVSEQKDAKQQIKSNDNTNLIGSRNKITKPKKTSKHKPDSGKKDKFSNNRRTCIAPRCKNI